jgi:4-hydroxy-3-polyprenylbenzoate decarboxylase
MPYSELREFLSRLEEIRDLVRVQRAVDWDLEAAAIARRATELQAPVPLFENVKDYPNHRLCGDFLATFQRMALALDLSSDASFREILEAFLKKGEHPIKPNRVSSGPCKEVVSLGDEVDLLKLPVPMVHGTDGGRYLGTLNVGMCKDPDSDWVNWGMYRLMVHDRDSLGILISPQQHAGTIFRKYEALNEPMPYVSAIGLDPAIQIGAASGIPYGQTEADFIGGLRGKPLELVRAETCDLLVPATAEIVIEGEILPKVRKAEGPFGEYQGYSVSGSMPRPIFKVKAITHRKNPILTMVCEGMPVTMGHTVANLTAVAEVWSDLRRQGMPVIGIYSPPEAVKDLIIVSTQTPFSGIAQRIATIVWANKGGVNYSKVMVVNEDIDPTDTGAVIHAFAARCHPQRGIHVMPNTQNVPLTPYLNRQERRLGRGANVLFDCTWPLDWDKDELPTKSSFDSIFSKEIQQKVLANWKEYGFA